MTLLWHLGVDIYWVIHCRCWRWWNLPLGWMSFLIDTPRFDMLLLYASLAFVVSDVWRVCMCARFVRKVVLIWICVCARIFTGMHFWLHSAICFLCSSLRTSSRCCVVVSVWKQQYLRSGLASVVGHVPNRAVPGYQQPTCLYAEPRAHSRCIVAALSQSNWYHQQRNR